MKDILGHFASFVEVWSYKTCHPQVPQDESQRLLDRGEVQQQRGLDCCPKPIHAILSILYWC